MEGELRGTGVQKVASIMIITMENCMSEVFNSCPSFTVRAIFA